MDSVFLNELEFNQVIGRWNVFNVRDMSRMFDRARKFNQDIGQWDVARVKGMNSMFYGACKFNGDIRNWNISNVEYMNNMVYCASAFDFDLTVSSWDVSHAQDKHCMLPEGFPENFHPGICSSDVFSNKFGA
ncbi:fibronectin domain containing protein [Nitzschia inconspicua]|uniref:Fibronectin domain containing protein n=1 Tax=Nitzschia inconspicua TaxID=303405 RepID=A0A9K3L663_9STRA|nr:fibronectin domain containing protein [Nitzschia inconspicua]